MRFVVFEIAVVQAECNARAEEMIGSLRTVRSFGSEASEAEDYRRKLQEMERLGFRQALARYPPAMLACERAKCARYPPAMSVCASVQSVLGTTVPWRSRSVQCYARARPCPGTDAAHGVLPACATPPF